MRGRQGEGICAIPSPGMLLELLQLFQAELEGVITRKVLGLHVGHVFIQDGPDQLGPFFVFFLGKGDDLVALGQGELLALLVDFVPALAGLLDPLQVDRCDHLLDIRGQGFPFVLVHDHEKAGGVGGAEVFRGGLDHLAEFPALQRFDGVHAAFGHTFLKRVVPFGHGHGHGGCTQGAHHLRAQAVTDDLHALQIVEVLDGLLGVQDSGPVGVEVHDLDVIELLGVEFLVIGVDEFGGGQAVLVTQGQVDDLGEREPPAGVAEHRHADVGDALHDAVVTLVGGGQRAAGEDGDLDRAIGALFDFLRPFGGEHRVFVRRGKEDGVIELDGVCRLNPAGDYEKQHSDEHCHQSRTNEMPFFHRFPPVVAVGFGCDGAC